MKELEFKQDTNTAKWYKFFWNKDNYDMPKDTCTYYRNTIFSIPLVILTFIGLILSFFTKKLNNFWDRAGATWSIILIPVIAGLVYVKNDSHHSGIVLWLYGIVVLICVIIVLAGCVGIVYLFELLRDHIKDKRRLKQSANEHDRVRLGIPTPPKQPNVLVAWYKQLKDKTCSKIKWVK